MNEIAHEAFDKGGLPPDSWNGAKGKTPPPRQAVPPTPKGNEPQQTNKQE